MFAERKTFAAKNGLYNFTLPNIIEVTKPRIQNGPQVVGKLRLSPIHIHNKSCFTYEYKWAKRCSTIQILNHSGLIDIRPQMEYHMFPTKLYTVFV